MKYLYVSITLLGLGLAFSCSKSQNTKECVDTLCNPGTVRCFGDYRAVCQLDGRDWSITFCGPHSYCENGACKKAECAAGLHFCDDTTRAKNCDDEGRHMTTTRCTNGQTCQYGFCLDKRCKDGEVLCNNNERVVCMKGLWTNGECREHTACNQQTKKCEKQVCQPFQAVCVDNDTRAVCNYNGSGFKTEDCPKGQYCSRGICMPQVCKETHDAVVYDARVMDADVMSQDTYDTQPPQDTIVDSGLPTKNQAEINGSMVQFTVEHDCTYSPAEQKLRIVLKGPPAGIGTHQDRVIVLLTGIQENQTGQFHCQDSGAVRVNVYYRWGKYTNDDKCPDFDYTATRCTVTIDKFGMRQGLVTGTFEAPVMQDCKQDGTQSVIKHGVFNAIRNF